MKPRTASPEPARIYPIARIDVRQLLELAAEDDLIRLLDDRMRDIYESYVNSFVAFREKMKAHDSYRLKGEDRKFRGAEEYFHPLYHQRWANEDDTYTRAQLERAFKAGDWQEVMVCAAMICVREMIHGRVVKAPKVEKKAAPKKPAAKKPATRKLAPPAPRATAPKAKKAAPADAKPVAKLAALVEQAKPHFKANPNLDREGLIAKIGRRYERLTTFAELKVLCAGKTPTTHSLKKPKRATEWPWPEGQTTVGAKPKRPRRDPQPPAAAPATPPAGARTKPWPAPDANGHYSVDDAEHVADFGSGQVAADFAVIETDNGWTWGYTLKVGEEDRADRPLHDNGPLAQSADGAIRDFAAEALGNVKRWLVSSEPSTDEARAIAPHVGDLLKLRDWLLGFQVKGVERIKFLREQKSGQLELAA